MPDTDLYPTPARVDLLREVAAGNVTGRYQPSLSKWTYTLRDGETRVPVRNVTAKIEEMLRANWVGVGLRESASVTAPAPVEIIRLGRAVLTERAR